MKNYLSLCLLCVCSVSYAQTLPPIYHPLPGIVRMPDTIFGTDAYSRAHPGDSSHAPTLRTLQAMGHSGAETFDADGRKVTYVWVPGTDHDYRIYVSGSGYTPAARQWIAQHFRIGAPPPREILAGEHRLPSASAFRTVGSTSPRQLSPLLVLAAMVVALGAAGVLGAVLSRRAS